MSNTRQREETVPGYFQSAPRQQEVGSATHLKAISKASGLILFARKVFTMFQLTMGAGSVSVSAGLRCSSHSVEACVVGGNSLFFRLR